MFLFICKLMIFLIFYLEINYFKMGNSTSKEKEITITQTHTSTTVITKRNRKKREQFTSGDSSYLENEVEKITKKNKF